MSYAIRRVGKKKQISVKQLLASKSVRRKILRTAEEMEEALIKKKSKKGSN